MKAGLLEKWISRLSIGFQEDIDTLRAKQDSRFTQVVWDIQPHVNPDNPHHLFVVWGFKEIHRSPRTKSDYQIHLGIEHFHISPVEASNGIIRVTETPWDKRETSIPFTLWHNCTIKAKDEFDFKPPTRPPLICRQEYI